MSRNKRLFEAHFQTLCGDLRAYSHTIMKASNTSKSRFLTPSERVRQEVGFDAFQWVVAGLGSLIWAGLCVLAFWIWPVAAMAQQAGVAAGTAGGASGLALQKQVEGLLSQAKLPQQAEQAGIQTDTQTGELQPWRFEIVLGQLNPRLKLAPCDKVHAYMPEGARMWGRTRVGLRCEQGPVRWNVYWPLTVKVWGRALVAAVPLTPGTPLRASDLHMAEVDLAAEASPAVLSAEGLIGRHVARGIAVGQSLRQDDIKARRWFAAGEPVRLSIKGQGFHVASQGTALTPGDEGRCARVRTESGRVICGLPTGDRQVELAL